MVCLPLVEEAEHTSKPLLSVIKWRVTAGQRSWIINVQAGHSKIEVTFLSHGFLVKCMRKKKFPLLCNVPLLALSQTLVEHNVSFLPLQLKEVTNPGKFSPLKFPSIFQS